MFIENVMADLSYNVVIIAIYDIAGLIYCHQHASVIKKKKKELYKSNFA